MHKENVTLSQPPLAGYHPVTRWLHAGLVVGVIFQLVCAALMAHPDHHSKVGTEAHATQQLAMVEQDGHAAHATAYAQGDMAEMQASEHAEEGWRTLVMQAHRIGGLLVILIVVLNVAWALILRGKPRKRQIAVLFSRPHWQEAMRIARDVPMMFIGRRALAEPGNSLSLIVEMLGLLTMLALALSGLIIWLAWDGPGAMVVDLAEFWMSVHGSIALLLFVYLSGHVSMAFLHLRSGDQVFARISPIGAKK